MRNDTTMESKCAFFNLQYEGSTCTHCLCGFQGTDRISLARKTTPYRRLKQDFRSATTTFPLSKCVHAYCLPRLDPYALVPLLVGKRLKRPLCSSATFPFPSAPCQASKHSPRSPRLLSSFRLSRGRTCALKLPCPRLPATNRGTAVCWRDRQALLEAQGPAPEALISHWAAV